MRIVACLLLSSLACGACERRIDEPPPNTQTSAERASATASASADGPRLPPCARPTPEKATREVQGPVPNPACPDDPGPVPELARGRVKFEGATGKPEVVLEIAERDADRQRGLMYRKEMPDTEGMLFVFERSKKLSFWMRNTCIPLDMIYVAEDFTIVNIEENTPTLTDQTFPSMCPAKYVIEVNAGWTRKHGVQVGQKVAIER
jgi:uncharacterized membrane protein (UPF0127 family)